MSKAISSDMRALCIDKQVADEKESKNLRFIVQCAKINLMMAVASFHFSNRSLDQHYEHIIKKHQIACSDASALNITLLLECLFVTENGKPFLLMGKGPCLDDGKRRTFENSAIDCCPLHEVIRPYTLNYTDNAKKYELMSLVMFCFNAGEKVSPFFEKLALQVLEIEAEDKKSREINHD